MKRFLLLLVILSSAFFASAKSDFNKENPYELIQQVSEKTFARFQKEQPEIKKNPNILKDIVREELIPYINYRYASLKVLGTNLRKQKREDVEKFIPVFRDYLVAQYAQVFTLYKQQKIEFEQEKKFDDRKTMSIDVKVLQPEGEPIQISFQVRKDSDTNEWKAFNMVAEGVSLLDSKRAELSSIIQQKGLPYVTELLREKSQRDIVFKS